MKWIFGSFVAAGCFCKGLESYLHYRLTCCCCDQLVYLCQFSSPTNSLHVIIECICVVCFPAWKRQRRTCMRSVPPRILDFNAPLMKKHLRNSRVGSYLLINESFKSYLLNVYGCNGRKPSRYWQLSLKTFTGLPGVLWVLPDSYIDVKNKDYGGNPSHPD